ncbi:MAG: Fe-S cluster assembly protein SufD [Hyphomicrobiaceae bacterium]|nr:Fe-S cluster assembly protein SufD [Hyphomicrobiaceae bacterium]
MTAAPKIQKTQAEQALARQFDETGANLPGNDWVKGLRNDAIRRFGELGLPHRRIEEWKYTDLRLMLKEALSPAGSELSKVSDSDLYKALGGDLHGLSAHHIVFVDGVYDEDNSFIISDEANQVFMTPLREVLDNPPSWFKEKFGKVNGQEDDPTLALNTAFMGDGAVLEIVKDAKLKRPVHLIYVSTSPKGEAITERNFIHAKEGANATILESYVHLRSPDTQRNSVTELLLDKGAKVSHIKFQHEGAKASHLSNWMISIGENADYRGFQFTLGAKLSRNNINVSFDGSGSKGDVSGIALLWDDQHADTTMKIIHGVPQTSSRELFKTVLDDRARAVFQGKLVVKPDAQQTDAKQMAHGMLLSETAEFDAKPELEIYADDVQCGHGATSGQLDEDMMFYMRQRGMSEETVQTLLILAFVGEALELIEDEDIREAFTVAAQAWLGGKSDE